MFKLKWHHMVRSAHMAKVLLDNGALPNAKCSTGETPLAMIIEYNNMDLIKCLIQYNANILDANRLEGTAVTIAKKYGYIEVEKFLNNIVLSTCNRKPNGYEKNVTIALSLRLFPEGSPLPYSHLCVSSLAPERIIEHAQRRVDLFFYTLIAYYKTRLVVERRPTKIQHGCGSGDTEACHSSILPSLVDSIIHQPSHQMGTRYNPKITSYKTSILDHTHFHNSLNSTVELHQSVNHFDTHYLEGKDTEKQKMRYKSLRILNEVSMGRLNPVDGMSQFLTALNVTFDEQQDRYFKSASKKKSPESFRKHIVNCQRLGSFANCHQVYTNQGSYLALNVDYIQLMLRLTTEEKKCFLQKYNESNEHFESRLHQESHQVYEYAYLRVKDEMAIPKRFDQHNLIQDNVSLVSIHGIFSKSTTHADIPCVCMNTNKA